MNLCHILQSSVKKEWRKVIKRYISKPRKYPVDNSEADLLPGEILFYFSHTIPPRYYLPKGVFYLIIVLVYDYPVRNEQCNSVHVWGKAEHGGLGIYLQKKEKMRGRKDQRFSKFNRPLRLTFAEQRHVTRVAAGCGFTLLVVKSQDGDTVFGTGINTDSQLGYHDPRRDAPLGLLLAPVPVLPQKFKNKVTA